MYTSTSSSEPVRILLVYSEKSDHQPTTTAAPKGTIVELSGQLGKNHACNPSMLIIAVEMRVESGDVYFVNGEVLGQSEEGCKGEYIQ